MTQSGIRNRLAPAIPFPRLLRKNFGKKPIPAGKGPLPGPHTGLDRPASAMMLGGVSAAIV